MNKIMICLAVLCTAATFLQAGESAATAPLGSAVYMPSPERPYGWRGDGSGRFPAATPPTKWTRAKSGSAYSGQNIQWMMPLPNAGVSCPVIVGNKIFLTAEPCDLVCLDKASGKIVWIRSSLEFEGLPDEERKANPAYAALEPLVAQLAKANQDAADALNAQQGAAMTGAAKPNGALNKKRDLEKQIQTQQQAIDKKLFERYWGQAVFGFAGQTPTTDGKNVCVFYTTGVTACYDLEGNRKWVARSKGGGSEHGNFASPLLCGNTVVVWANEMRGYDVATGKLLWTNPAKGNNTYGSMFKIQAGPDLVAAFQCGYFTRIRDGKPIWDAHLFGDCVATPIVENGTIFATVGYPKNNDAKTGFRAFKVPASTDVPKLTQSHVIKTEWADDELAIVKDKNPFDRGFNASPLMVDGLIYRMTEGGGLIVNDAATGEIAYRKVLPMKARTHYWDWAGASTSPTLAGKYIYLMDNQGTTVVIEPGKQYKEVAVNLIEESSDGKSQVQNVSTPIFEGTRMYYRTPGFLYCIGEK